MSHPGHTLSQNLLFHSNFLCLIYIAAPAPPRKTRGELYKDVDADYYGYRDEDDGVLVPLEQDVEKEGLSLTFGYWYSLNSSKMLLKFSVYFEAYRLVVRTKKLSDQWCYTVNKVVFIQAYTWSLSLLWLQWYLACEWINTVWWIEHYTLTQTSFELVTFHLGEELVVGQKGISAYFGRLLKNWGNCQFGVWHTLRAESPSIFLEKSGKAQKRKDSTGGEKHP